MTLQPSTEHPHGLSDRDYDAIFTKDKPIIFAFHGYPWLIHRLVYRRANQRLHVRGYKEEGTVTTPFDMCVLNDMDRLHLAIDVLDRVERLHDVTAHKRQLFQNILVDHRNYIEQYGEDMPEIRNWTWPY
jgi:xylulose-5-phosphate/fructose-6-phosphate phosphoketolase